MDLRRLTLAVALLGAAALPARGGDYPQWGRDGSRNMVSDEKGLPADFDPGKTKAGAEEIDPATTRKVKWVARLGSRSFGNPTVAGGKVFVGTDNEPPRDPTHPQSGGALLCLDEATGKLAWQLIVPRLEAGSWNDDEQGGLCSPATVDGDRVYIVTNRCEVLCLDIHGLANGNDGPFKEEGQYLAGRGKPAAELSPTDADILWRFDMRDGAGVFPCKMTSGSPLILGDRLYVNTSNGVDWTARHVPAPEAPALICLDKKTGRLLGEERSGISARTFHSNWSSPALCDAGGKNVVVFGGGDGFCYGFDPQPVAAADGAGTPVLKELWRYDCNPPGRRTKDGKPARYPSPEGPSEVLATPVCYKGRVYVSVGHEPDSGDGSGCLSCIDAGKAGDVSAAGKIWSFDKIGWSLSAVSIADGLVYAGDYAGFVRCFDAESGKLYWEHDTESHVWGSTLLADGKVYVGAEGGALTVLAAGKEKKVLGTATFAGQVCSTPVAANGVLFVGTDRQLYAIQEGAK